MACSQIGTPILANCDLLLTGPLETNFTEIWIEMFKKSKSQKIYLWFFIEENASEMVSS